MGYETLKQVGRPRIYHKRHTGSGEKRPSGRPRIHPIKPQSEKRPRSRPRIYPVRPKLNRPRGRPPKNWKPLDTLMCSTSTTGSFSGCNWVSISQSDLASSVPVDGLIFSENENSTPVQQEMFNRDNSDDDSIRTMSSSGSDSATSGRLSEEIAGNVRNSETEVPNLPLYIISEHSYVRG